MEKDHIIFLHSALPRCGHNFLANLLRERIDLNTLSHKTYEAIGTRFFSDKYVELTRTKRVVHSKQGKLLELNLMVEGYRDKVLATHGTTVMKNPFFRDISQIELFPLDKQILLYRNPYDLFISFEKAIYSFPKKTLKNSLKKLIRPFYSLYCLFSWKKNLFEVLTIMDQQLEGLNCCPISYHSLFTPEGQRKLFSYLEIDFDDADIVEVKENNNSSFLSNKYRWHTHNQDIGDPKNRFKNASFWLRGYCNLFLNRERKLFEKIESKNN